MKNFSERKNGVYSNKFLVKFLSSRKNTDINKEKENQIGNNSLKIITETDYNSIEWLDKFSKKKKDKFIQKAKENINKIKTSRNFKKKNDKNNINRLYSFSKDGSVNNLLKSKFSMNKTLYSKKGISSEKNRFNQIKLIKQLKKELKENPEKLENLVKNKSTDKIKNIKIERVISNENKKFTNSYHFIKSNKNKYDNNNSTSSKKKIMNNTNIEIDSKYKRNLYNKSKSKSNDLREIKSLKNSKLKNDNNIKFIHKKRNIQTKFYSTNNSKFLGDNKENNKISQSQKNIIGNQKEKILLYRNIKIKIIENPKITKKKLNNNYITTITEPTNETIKLNHFEKFKSNDNRSNSENNIQFRLGTKSLMKNKYRDLICEYESEIDS
jgi:hypothetical protein